jgi:hypothetical protein
MDPSCIDYLKNALRKYIVVIYMKETYLGGNEYFITYPMRFCDPDKKRSANLNLMSVAANR